MPNSFPEFERPPVDEVAMGVQFDPLPNFRAAHIGCFWARIREEYPHTEEQAPLFPAVEPSEFKPSAPTVSAVALAVPPLPRCWFLNQDKSQLIQIQSDRFLRNWRHVKGDESYPRFARLFQDFRQAWDKFLTFARDEGLGSVNVNQCELTYINSIEKGSGWRELGELHGVFPLLCPREEESFLPPPETLSWHARYKLPEGRGRLHVDMKPVFRGRDLKLVLAFTLTARGAPAEGSPEQIAAWFELSHEWIVRAFAELTNSTAHELWGKKA
ncbi:MAG: TIGR04255 family protein [Gemmataceae bacterium]